MCTNNNDCKCISDILKVISILQKNAHRHEEIDDTCDKKHLGDDCFDEFNTRPVQLILCGQNGDNPLVMPTNKGPITPCTKFSDVFRLEKIDDCCATFRVLEEKHKEQIPANDQKDKPVVEINTKKGKHHKQEFKATRSFFTLDLKCVCIIKCLDDVHVKNV